VLIAVIGACVVAATVVVVNLWPHDTARPVDADEAVQRFRNSTTSAVVTAPDTTIDEPDVATVPRPGVYEYRTTGSEWVDALGGTTHQYPPSTLLTVTADGGCVSVRWDLLVERREEWRLCATDEGIEVQSNGAAYHEFYGSGRFEATTCDRSVLVVPLDGEPRVGEQLTCILGDHGWDPRWDVLGMTELTVESTPITVTHVRMTIANDDHYYEHTVVDWWLDEHGLPVRMTTTKESNSDSGVIGDVVYKETYQADLVSTTPLT